MSGGVLLVDHYLDNGSGRSGGELCMRSPALTCRFTQQMLLACICKASVLLALRASR